MTNFVNREKRDVVVSDSLGYRAFDKLSKEAQQLVLVTKGDKRGQEHQAIDCFIKNLGVNLSRSDKIQNAAQRIYTGQYVHGTSEDYLMMICHDVVRKYHKGTYTHMVQVYQFLCLLHALIKDQGETGLSNYGTEERRIIKHLTATMDEKRWDKVKLAGIIHDVCKMAYFLEFWLETGKFNKNQKSLVPFHTSLFLPLAEMFDVDPEITALAVLHHYLINDYPGEDIVHLFDNLFLDDTFCFMVEAMNLTDCYSALRAKRPEYRPAGAESFTHGDAFDKVESIVNNKGMGRWILTCIKQLYSSGHINQLFPEKQQSPILVPA